MSTTRTTIASTTTRLDALEGKVDRLADLLAAFVATQTPAPTARLPKGNAAVKAAPRKAASAKAPKAKPEVLTFVCVECGEEGIRKAANQVRCTECRLDREAVATTAWAKAREEARPVNKALSALLQEANLPIGGAAWKAAKAAKAAGKNDRQIVVAARKANNDSVRANA